MTTWRRVDWQRVGEQMPYALGLGWLRQIAKRSVATLRDQGCDQAADSLEEAAGGQRYCWFHEFEHPFDGISDGWMCHAYQPQVIEGELRIAP